MSKVASKTGRVTLPKKEKKETKAVEQVIEPAKEDRQEKNLIKVVEELSGVKLTVDQIKKILSNLNVEPNKEFTDDDLLLIYNIFTEPLIGKENNQFMYDKFDETENPEDYINQVLNDSTLFKRVLAVNRVQAMYEYLPSLEDNRINFRIDKDIFRNKPLLGRGLYKCIRCGSEDTEDREKQTRAADEPMTVFVNCRKCGHKWKFN